MKSSSFSIVFITVVCSNKVESRDSDSSLATLKSFRCAAIRVIISEWSESLFHQWKGSYVSECICFLLQMLLKESVRKNKIWWGNCYCFWFKLASKEDKRKDQGWLQLAIFCRIRGLRRVLLLQPLLLLRSSCRVDLLEDSVTVEVMVEHSKCPEHIRQSFDHLRIYPKQQCSKYISLSRQWDPTTQ